MRDGFVSHTAEGALGGALGTLFMHRARRLGRHLPAKLKPPELRREPGAFLIARIEELRGKPFPARVHDRLAEGIGWAYGIAWGGLLGLLTRRRLLRRPRDAALAGVALGAGLWAFEYVGVLPALKLTPPVRRQGLRHIASALGLCLAYGLVCSAPILLLDRAARPSLPWYRRLFRSIER